MGYGGPQGYGEGGYGEGELLPPILSTTPGCTPLMLGPSGYWALGVQDDGDLKFTSVNFTPLYFNPPVLRANGRLWQLAIDAPNLDSQGYGTQPYGTGGYGEGGTDSPSFENITVTEVFRAPVIFDYIPLRGDPTGVPWTLTVSQDGNLTVTSVFSLLPDQIPIPEDVTMSVYGTNQLFCISCGNATVTALASLALWCCTCSSYVPPEDTNIIVILDE